MRTYVIIFMSALHYDGQFSFINSGTCQFWVVMLYSSWWYQVLDCPHYQNVQLQGAPRALHEYQFLPEKPSIRKDANEGVVPSHYNGYPIDIQNAGVSLPYGRSIMHGKENLSSAYNLQSQMPSMGFQNQPGRLAHSLSPSPGELDVAPRSPALVNGSMDAHFIAHPINGLVNTMIPPEMRIVHEEERFQRKRKVLFSILKCW